LALIVRGPGFRIAIVILDSISEVKEMSHDLEFSDLAQAMSAVRNLKTAKAEAEARLADCLKNLASEEGMLNSLLAEPKTPADEASRKAFRAGIKAWKASIAAYQHDINSCQAEIDAILTRNPEARVDH
jgi:hypothetical protein